MNWIGLFITLLEVAVVLVSVLLIFVVLLQRPKNEGLGAAFGGDTASNLFGAQTTNVLATLTRWLGGFFLLMCLVIAFLGTRDTSQKLKVEKFLQENAAARAALLKEEETRQEGEKNAAEAKAKAEAEAKAKADAENPPKEPAVPVEGQPATPETPATPGASTPATPAPATPTPAAPAAPATPTEAPKPVEGAPQP